MQQSEALKVKESQYICVESFEDERKEREKQQHTKR
jgi:hypothetical protein